MSQTLVYVQQVRTDTMLSPHFKPCYRLGWNLCSNTFTPESCWCPGAQGNIVSCSGTSEAELGAGKILGRVLLFTTDLSNSPSHAKNGNKQNMTEMLPLGVQNTPTHRRELEMKVNKHSCREI